MSDNCDIAVNMLTNMSIIFRCALMGLALAHDEVRLVNIWCAAHFCEKYQQKMPQDMSRLQSFESIDYLTDSDTHFVFICIKDLFKKLSQIIHKCICSKWSFIPIKNERNLDTCDDFNDTQKSSTLFTATGERLRTETLFNRLFLMI